MSEKVIIFNGQKLSYQENQTILDALKANNVPVEYQCQEGYCGACRCKLKKGNVTYTRETLAYIDDDEILTCSTMPLSNIYISN
jgi:ferredoxin